MSTSSSVATPSSTRLIASLSSTYCSRLSTKPALSLTRAVSLPVTGTKASTASMTASSVPECAISSTPGMNGAGLEKWMPRKRSGCTKLTARSPIGRVEVLLPITASGRAADSILRRTGPLTSGRSKTASSMRSASATASATLSAARRFFRTSSAEPGSNSPRFSKSSASWRSRSRWRAVTAGIGVRDHHIHARHREDLGDSATHVSCTDDGDVLDHRVSPLRKINRTFRFTVD